MNEDIKDIELMTDDDGEIDYAASIKKMREGMVDRAEYDKLRKENKQLLNALTNGETLDKEPQAAPVDIKVLSKELLEGRLNNLDYVKKSLDLRDAIIEQGGRDPFLPYGDHVDITSDMVEKAQNVAKVFRECVDFADGDSAIFTAELQRRTVDASPYSRRR